MLCQFGLMGEAHPEAISISSKGMGYGAGQLFSEPYHTQADPEKSMKSTPKKSTEGSFPKGVGQPATRALASIDVTRVDQVTRFTERELLALHGMGPKAIRVMGEELSKVGKSFKKEK